jgi:hypothetical protein
MTNCPTMSAALPSDTDISSLVAALNHDAQRRLGPPNP